MLTKEVKIFDSLKSEKDIGQVYRKGKVIISTDRKIKANYISAENLTNRIKFAITVSSKTGNSIWRNRFKRIVRESLRLELASLKEINFKGSTDLLIVFSPYTINQTNNRRLFQKDIKPALSDILNKLRTTSRPE
jgi:ribonuclease P protein component